MRATQTPWLRRVTSQDGQGAAALPTRESIEIRCLVLYGDGLEKIAPNFCNASMAGPDAPVKAREAAALTELELYNLISSTVLPPGDEW